MPDAFKMRLKAPIWQEAKLRLRALTGTEHVLGTRYPEIHEFVEDFIKEFENRSLDE